MFKALLLQSWYKLSDPALEKQLARDLLFRRFIDLDISESVPDHSSFWRFRQTLESLLLIDKLLSEINAQLAELSLYISCYKCFYIQAPPSTPLRLQSSTLSGVEGRGFY